MPSRASGLGYGSTEHDVQRYCRIVPDMQALAAGTWRACLWSSSTTTTTRGRTRGSSSAGRAGRPTWSLYRSVQSSGVIVSVGSSTSTVGPPDEVTEKGLTIHVYGQPLLRQFRNEDRVYPGLTVR